MASGDHYFSADPASPEQRRPLAVRLAGEERRLVTASGVFSPDRIDSGTRVLLEAAPRPPADGDLADVGCGWGPLALTLALESPAATVWAIDVNERALDLVRENARRLGLDNVTAVRPDRVPGTVSFRALWSNPPIRVGKPALHGLLTAWLPRLEADAEAHLVVQRNLGADSLQRWLNETLDDLEAERVSSSRGYRILRVRREA